MVVVSGPAGIGRTRLAAELAGELHREGVLVLYGAGRRRAGARRAAADAARARRRRRRGTTGLAGLARELASRPVLVVAIAGDTGWPPAAGRGAARARAARRRRRSRRSRRSTRPTARGSPSRSSPSAAAECRGARTDSRPSGRARRRRAALSPVADRAAAERGDLRRAEQELAATVAEVQAVRERAELQRPARASTVCPFKGLRLVRRRRRRALLRPRAPGRRDGRRGSSARRCWASSGASGSGKSSAVRAGLLAELAGGVLPGSERWARVAAASRRAPDVDAGARDAPSRAGTGGCCSRSTSSRRCFTLCRDEAERAAFVDALVAAAAEGDAAVVLAVRADFYGRCAAYPELARLLAANHVLVGPMRRDELRRAIELPGAARRPARRARARRPAAVRRRARAGSAAAALDARCSSCGSGARAAACALAGYERTGGVRGAVARLAEAAYERLDPAQQAIARRILLRLAGEDAGGGAVRRRVALEELDADRDDDVRRVLDVLAAGRLVTVSAGTVEVAHEALLREWPRLRGWLEEDAEGRRAAPAAGGRGARMGRGRARPGRALPRRAPGRRRWTGAPAHAARAQRASSGRSSTRAAARASARRGRARRTNRRLRTLLGGVRRRCWCSPPSPARCSSTSAARRATRRARADARAPRRAGAGRGRPRPRAAARAPGRGARGLARDAQATCSPR